MGLQFRVLASILLYVFNTLAMENCTKIVSNNTVAPHVFCDGKTEDLCSTYIDSWKVVEFSYPYHLTLDKCKSGDIVIEDHLLMHVGCSSTPEDYGKYDVVRVGEVKTKHGNKCAVTLKKPGSKLKFSEKEKMCITVQKFIEFETVVLRNKCTLTCKRRADGLGGLLAFTTKLLDIDRTSKIDMTAQGFVGGSPGDNRGGGGFGGETFICPMERTMGKGGDISTRGSWRINSNGIGSGGAGDGPRRTIGSKGGSGGPNAGGGGGDSTVNSDDGAAGGGGGGHFSGGGGGGGGSGCGGRVGGSGGTASNKTGVQAGGGGRSACPGQNGGNGGQSGASSGFCYDRSARGGEAGTDKKGGGGGDSCGNHFGGGGGGGGLEYGNKDFNNYIGMGGGGGGGGASAFKAPDAGKGGNGGGIVLAHVTKFVLNGYILAAGEQGQCVDSAIRHRSAPGGSGAGGSVVIKTDKLQITGGASSLGRHIAVNGGQPVKCGFGVGGGGGGGVGRFVVSTPNSTHTSDV